MANNESIIPSSIKKSIIDSFQVQASIKVDVADVVTEDNTSILNRAIECMSMLGIKDPQYTGTIALSFPKSTFLGVVEKMLGEKHESINAEIADACSELLNIIYSSARVNINASGFNFQPAIPSTVFGKALDMALGSNTKVMNFACKCDYGIFWVTLSLKKS